jgi:hypothetical protein
MQNKLMLKLIGHRPVYRVERNPAPGVYAGEADGFVRNRYGVPVIDREERCRFISGAEDHDLPEGVLQYSYS